jgi:hypothetical protein
MLTFQQIFKRKSLQLSYSLTIVRLAHCWSKVFLAALSFTLTWFFAYLSWASISLASRLWQQHVAAHLASKNKAINPLCSLQRRCKLAWLVKFADLSAIRFVHLPHLWQWCIFVWDFACISYTLFFLELRRIILLSFGRHFGMPYSNIYKAFEQIVWLDSGLCPPGLALDGNMGCHGCRLILAWD